MKKIMFVCHGNICRSPMAKYIFKHITNDEFIIESRATSTEEIGNDLYYLTKDILDKHNIPYDTHMAKQLTNKEYDEYDYIIVFDEYNKNNVKRLIGDDSKVKKLLSKDIDDPWYTRDFETAYKDILEGCNKLYEELK